LEELQPQVQAQVPAENKVNWKQFAWDLIENNCTGRTAVYWDQRRFGARTVDGFSMQPTLDDGEFVLVNRMSYRFGDIERGDIIVFNYPANPDQELDQACDRPAR